MFTGWQTSGRTISFCQPFYLKLISSCTCHLCLSILTVQNSLSLSLLDQNPPSPISKQTSWLPPAVNLPGQLVPSSQILPALDGLCPSRLPSRAKTACTGTASSLFNVFLPCYVMLWRDVCLSVRLSVLPSVHTSHTERVTLTTKSMPHCQDATLYI